MQSPSQPQNLPTFKKQAVFMLDQRDSQIPTYILIAVQTQGALEIVAVRLRELSSEEINFENLSSFVESIGVQTYLSDRNLPNKLFQMKSIDKLFNYFTDEANRVIRASIKPKNGTDKIVLEPMVPVTRNIHDFVPLQLDIIDPNYMSEFIETKKPIIKLIFDQMQQDQREIIEQANRKLEFEQQLKKKEEQAVKLRSDEQMSEGEMSWLVKATSQRKQSTCQGNPREFEVVCDYPHVLLEQVEENIEKIKGQIDQQSEEDQFQHGNFQLEESDDSVDEGQCLRGEHTVLLEEQNERLLKRVVELQTLLIKKSFKLQLYENLEGRNESEGKQEKFGLQKISLDQKNRVEEQVKKVQRKYENKIQDSMESVETLRSHFILLKALLLQTDMANKPNQQNVSQTKNSIKNKKRVQKVMSQMQEVFESL